ncbi:SCP2 sterol-binding domain-containing protein [Crenobacter sp. SG2303]|uniref:SCP2 sterol-binding domain-containing protein n=1 Tax=Crenobacter oryzisoli TaxID=3056844 RepID=A0ABT7XST2_9NEIS|nr:SCP2 sterol-binding domain-containing protein [Crenobacter sp. SG2303]MDN0076599.1 SCP2 sterol-binding domain-containing protein [Crenobacter sp. SG2303]
MSELNFDFLAAELEQKATKLGNLGARLKFVFEGEGAVHIDASIDPAVVCRDGSLEADITITAPLKVWVDLRAKKLAPHVAALTRKIKISGNLGLMKLAPRIMAVL